MIETAFEHIVDPWNEYSNVSYPGVPQMYFGLFQDLGLHVTAPSTTYLGLAAGGAKAERLMAELLEMPDVVLVDLTPEKLSDFDGEYEAADLIDYLCRTSKKFGVVTAFGIDYHLITEDNWRKFWDGIDRVTTKGSMIFINNLPSNSELPNASKYQIHFNSGGLIVEKIVD